jgi:hypothetical protein
VVSASQHFRCGDIVRADDRTVFRGDRDRLSKDIAVRCWLLYSDQRHIRYRNIAVSEKLDRIKAATRLNAGEFSSFLINADLDRPDSKPRGAIWDNQFDDDPCCATAFNERVQRAAPFFHLSARALATTRVHSGFPTSWAYLKYL